MDYTQASTKYLSHLRAASDLSKHALRLSELPAISINPERLKHLRKQKEVAEKQCKRLEQKEFRIAVVGLEKSGKSTFVNAWLGYDLLPSDPKRCTFTPTQIYSVTSEDDQRLEIYPWTSAEFDQVVADLHKMAKLGGSSAKAVIQDLKAIQNHRHSLNEVVGKGIQKWGFTQLEDIRELLREHVARASTAHAVREARLYTQQLSTADGVVFYDVPGLDSGLEKHLKDSEQMLSDCDAVILVQNNTEIRGAEKDLLKFAELGDMNVPVKDKFFVFLSKVDMKGSPEALERHVSEARRLWKETYGLPEDRILFGSAAMSLVLSGIALPATVEELGDPAKLLYKFDNVCSDSQLWSVEEQCGIGTIKRRVNTFLKLERVTNLQKRAETCLNDIESIVGEIFQQGKALFTTDPEKALREQSEIKNEEFVVWWNKVKWPTIKAEITKHWHDEVIAVLHTESNKTRRLKCMEPFKERYRTLLADKLSKLEYKQSSAREQVFHECSFPHFSPEKANQEWRNRLHTEIFKVLEEIAFDLAAELQGEARQIVAKMQDLLWGSNIESKLSGYGRPSKSALDINYLQNAFEILFFRFARPVTDAVIRAPVGSTLRSEIILHMDRDAMIFDDNYTGKEKAFSDITRYCRHGVKLLIDAKLREELLKDIPSVHPAMDALKLISAGLGHVQTVSSAPIEERKKIELEVEGDLIALEDMLFNSVYRASAFETFCVHELQRLFDKFLDYSWGGIAQNEWIRKNPRLMAELPPHLKDSEPSINLEGCNRLRQLDSSLKSFQEIRS